VIDDVSVAIEQVGDDDASLEWYIEHYVRLDPRARGMTVASMRRFEQATSPWRLLVARVVEEVVGVAYATGKPHEQDSPTLLVGLTVDPEARGLGIGTRLYDELLAWARSARDQPRLKVGVPEADERSVAWWMRRGLRVEERHITTRLDLTGGSVVGDVDPPEGIELTTLAQRPDLERAAHAMLCETLADIPGEAFAPPTFDEWIELVRSGARPADAIHLALDGDAVVGICTTSISEADTERAHTGFTGVVPAARGRGIAPALKVRQVEWCRAAGYVELETVNHADNAPMRAINQRMGFVDEPAQLALGGVPNGYGTSESRAEA
jgi:GNAT superfamily N-acetyltransferase